MTTNHVKNSSRVHKEVTISLECSMHADAITVEETECTRGHTEEFHTLTNLDQMTSRRTEVDERSVVDAGRILHDGVVSEEEESSKSKY